MFIGQYKLLRALIDFFHRLTIACKEVYSCFLAYIYFRLTEPTEGDKREIRVCLYKPLSLFFALIFKPRNSMLLPPASDFFFYYKYCLILFCMKHV